jgi:hypothetical protein
MPDLANLVDSTVDQEFKIQKFHHRIYTYGKPVYKEKQKLDQIMRESMKQFHSGELPMQMSFTK